MKKYIISALLFVLITIALSMKNIWKVDNEYIIVNELRTEIPSYIIKKTDGFYTVVFDFNDLLPYNTLVISPINKLIGLPNGGRKRYVKITKNYIYDKDFNDKSYKIFYLDGKEPYTNNEYPNEEAIIKNIKFTENNGVEFDAFGELKKYGSRIIIQKK